MNSNFLLWHDPWLGRAPLLNMYDMGIGSVTDTSNLTRVGALMDN